MRTRLFTTQTLVGLAVAALLCSFVCPVSADEEGFKTIFDGKTLKGWDGDPDLWRVEDGAITGETKEPRKGPNTFIIWRGGEPQDFELRVEYKIRNHNSGIQYRSWEEPDNWGKWVVGGYQADMVGEGPWNGILYGERYRGILAKRGEKVVIGEDGKPKVVGSVGDGDKLNSVIKKNDWNEYTIIAKGFHFIHKINGKVMVDVVDDDTSARRKKGIIAFQLHAGPAMKVQFRNIRLKQLDSKKN